MKCIHKITLTIDETKVFCHKCNQEWLPKDEPAREIENLTQEQKKYLEDVKNKFDKIVEESVIEAMINMPGTNPREAKEEVHPRGVYSDSLPKCEHGRFLCGFYHKPQNTDCLIREKPPVKGLSAGEAIKVIKQYTDSENTDCWLECPLCHADLEGNTLIAHLKAGCQDKKQECPPKLCGCGSTCCAHGKQEEPEPSDLLDRMWSDLVLYRAEEKKFRKDVAEIMSGWTDGNSMRQAIKDFCKKYLPKGL